MDSAGRLAVIDAIADATADVDAAVQAAASILVDVAIGGMEAAATAAPVILAVFAISRAAAHDFLD